MMLTAVTPTRTRESWMLEGIALIAPIFERAGYQLPPVRISIGWTSKGASVRHGKVTLAECIATRATADHINQIYVTPERANGIDVLDDTVHELIHAVLDCQGGHGAKFQAMMRDLGLVGAPRSACAGPLLRAQLERIAQQLGLLPHAAVNLAKQPGPKKQTCRQLKIECPVEGCGYKLRGAAAILRRGLPNCPCCDVPMQLDPKAVDQLLDRTED